MTDFIHEAPPPENPKPAAPEKPTSEKERQKRVYAYIAVLFTVAFILILWSFLANHRSNQQVIDQLKERMRTNHIMRLKNGDCSIETGFVLSDILTNLERVSDHCSNIAVAMIEVAADKFDTHEYLASVKHGGSVKFEQRYEKYRGRYTFPPETYAEMQPVSAPGNAEEDA